MLNRLFYFIMENRKYSFRSIQPNLCWFLLWLAPTWSVLTMQSRSNLYINALVFTRNHSLHHFLRNPNLFLLHFIVMVHNTKLSVEAYFTLVSYFSKKYIGGTKWNVFITMSCKVTFLYENKKNMTAVA